MWRMCGLLGLLGMWRNPPPARREGFRGSDCSQFLVYAARRGRGSVTKNEGNRRKPQGDTRYEDLAVHVIATGPHEMRPELNPVL
jgi:hypothetical protein